MVWSQSAPATKGDDIEERLKRYVNQEVKALRSEAQTLRSEVLARLADRGSVRIEEAGAAAEQLDKGVKCAEPAVPALAEHLEQQDSHVLRESIWECSALIGLDCIGASESLVVLVLLLLNAFVQVFFCWIIGTSSMLEDPLSNERLNSLLRFRTSIAHDVVNANVVSQRSLLAQVCEGKEHLHISGTQRTLVGDLRDFEGVGRILCFLALFCWGASIVAEVRATLRFALAVLHRRARSTRILARSEGEVLIMESLSTLHIAKTFMLGVVPRLVSAGILCVLGFLYLVRTSTLEDLLLNAMALAFILDVDELVFSAFAPSRVRSLLEKLAPLHFEPASMHLHHRARAFSGLPRTALQVISLGVALVVADQLYLLPLQGRLAQAVDILCSGNQHFVYSVSSASGMVVATPSASAESSWAAAECAVLQVAHPNLREGSGWAPPKAKCSGIDMTQLEASVASAPVIFRPVGVESLAVASASLDETDFKYVSLLSSANVQQAVASSLCKDQVSAGVESLYLAALQDAVAAENSSLVVSSCSDVQQLCHQMNMTRVRALCPQTCQCAYWGFTRSGFFRTPTYGCPMQCQVQARAISSFWKADDIDPLKCLDFDNQPWFSQIFLSGGPKTKLVDHDQNGNITEKEMVEAVLGSLVRRADWEEFFRFDADSNGIWDATERGLFEAFRRFDLDDDDRLSGAEVEEALKSSFGREHLDWAMDADADGALNKSEIAGREVGEVKPLPPSFVGSMLDDESIGFFLLGMREYLLSLPDFRETLKVNVHLIGTISGWDELQENEVVEHITSGKANEDWMRGEWNLGPGLPHPRMLEWCEFLTSWELQMLLSINFCDAGDFSSLRTFCPQSCGCQADLLDCPYSCPSAIKLARNSS